MSLTFTYNIDLGRAKLTSGEVNFLNDHGQADLFENMLSGALSTLYPDGLTDQKQRSMKRLLTKLDKSSNSGSFDLECAELDLLKEAFSENVGVAPKNLRIFGMYQEEVERCVEKSKE